MPLRISAKTDYALRAAAELATADGSLVKGETIAQAQGIPLRYLLNILSELRNARIVRSHRGADGGYRLARPAQEITLADVVVAVEGSLAVVQDLPPAELAYAGPAGGLRVVWLAVQDALQAVLGSVTLADLASGSLPHPRLSLFPVGSLDPP